MPWLNGSGPAEEHEDIRVGGEVAADGVSVLAIQPKASDPNQVIGQLTERKLDGEPEDAESAL